MTGLAAAPYSKMLAVSHHLASSEACLLGGGVGGDFRLTYPASLAGTVTSTVDGPMVSDARDLRIIDALGR